jgi:hypothetical protein
VSSYPTIKGGRFTSLPCSVRVGPLGAGVWLAAALRPGRRSPKSTRRFHSGRKRRRFRRTVLRELRAPRLVPHDFGHVAGHQRFEANDHMAVAADARHEMPSVPKYVSRLKLLMRAHSVGPVARLYCIRAPRAVRHPWVPKFEAADDMLNIVPIEGFREGIAGEPVDTSPYVLNGTTNHVD